METTEIISVIRDEIFRQKTNAYRAARDAGLTENAFRYVLEGRETKIGRLIEICSALGLELYIGPPRPAASPQKTPDNPDTSGLIPVSDKRLARILALFADEWEAADERGRENLATRFHAYFPELAGGGRRYAGLSAGSDGK